MSKFITIVAASLVAISASAQTLEQTAGTYTAYPTPAKVSTPPPAGFEPFYISHYGRHGSRWITDDYRYAEVLKPLADAKGTNLTPIGTYVCERVQGICKDGIGNSGKLTPIGAQQHRGIAQRMHENFPQVFDANKDVVAVSSTSPRCIASMEAFTSRLCDIDSTVRLSKSANESNMQYIAYTSPEAKAFSALDAPWRAEHFALIDSTINPERLMNLIFVKPNLSPQEAYKLMEGLYWMASNMQDVEYEETLYDIFTYEELQALWRTINARMYACNGDYPPANGVMLHCADNLLADFIAKADAAIAGNGPAANLRFGHDTHLLRLMARMGIENATGREESLAKCHRVWQDYRLSPMAANLQLILYRNATGKVLAKILVNESEATLPIESNTTPYYPWDAVKALWQ